MKDLPEVFVDLDWSKTLNFIIYKLESKNEFILKSRNDKAFQMNMDCILYKLCDEMKFYKKVKKWKDGDEIKVHLKRI